MNLKDVLYFSKGQRIGIVVMVVLIVLALLLNVFLPKLVVREKTGFNTQFNEEVARFKQSLVLVDSVKQMQWQQAYEERYRQNYTNWNNPKYYSNSESYTLFTFDPNTLDSAGFVRLGLKPTLAATILKYRKKGGTFRQKSDFAKIYGLRAEKFSELEAYINIAAQQSETASEAASPTPTETPLTAENIIVELNTADTAELMRVKGIGRFYARGIVALRNSFGGFAQVDQLLELKNMRPENYEKIKNSFTIDASKIRKISINTATTQRLGAHPYINFYQAKAIYELRRKKGKLKNIDDLKKEFQNEKDFTEDWYHKIAVYLSFD
ncbi:MAG: helix-hairpin-helix domain-containing protein [Prevotellaceae bacterium]|jgi:DNA uptake protein ComE-like DNA-binding protein|nr:helix-hairpin-helix domain-containing protein [Prevotellaceae bacterium]